MVSEKLLTYKMWLDSDAFIKDLNVFAYVSAGKRLFWEIHFFFKVDPSYRNKEEYDNIVLKITTYIIKLTKIVHDGA